MPTELREAIDMAADLALAHNQPVLIAEWGRLTAPLEVAAVGSEGIVIERHC